MQNLILSMTLLIVNTQCSCTQPTGNNRNRILFKTLLRMRLCLANLGRGLGMSIQHELYDSCIFLSKNVIKMLFMIIIGRLMIRFTFKDSPQLYVVLYNLCCVGSWYPKWFELVYTQPKPAKTYCSLNEVPSSGVIWETPLLKLNLTSTVGRAGIE